MEGETERFLAFPDEYYEVTFLKFSLYALLPFERFCEGLPNMVGLLDNWATVDGFHAPCIATHKEEFLPYIRAFSRDGREFVERYALVSLLHDYVEEKYLPEIFAALEEADGTRYYTGMGAAWLMAEVLVKRYEEGLAYLKEGRLIPFVHNMAIREGVREFPPHERAERGAQIVQKSNEWGQNSRKGLTNSHTCCMIVTQSYDRPPRAATYGGYDNVRESLQYARRAAGDPCGEHPPRAGRSSKISAPIPSTSWSS